MTCCKDGCESGASFTVAPLFNDPTIAVKRWPVCSNHLQDASIVMAEFAPAVDVQTLKQGERV